MPSETVPVRYLDIHSASNGIDGGTGCDFIIFWIKYNYIDQSIVCVVYSFRMIHEYTLLKSKFLQFGQIAPCDHIIQVGPYETIITFEPS